MTKAVRFPAAFVVLTLLIMWLPACKTYRPVPIEQVFPQLLQLDFS